MMPITRRHLMSGLLSTGASLTGFRTAATPLGIPTILRVTSRHLDILGKPAKVYGIMQPSGAHGLAAVKGDEFQVRLENGIDEPTLVHWHGMTPGWRQDGVPGISQDVLAPNAIHDYRFPLTRSGTHWMHSHHELQEQRLLAAPLIVRDADDTSRDEQEVVVVLHDFTFRDPSEVLSELTGETGIAMDHSKMGHAPKPATAAGGAVSAPVAPAPIMQHGAHGGAMDLNDVTYDAFLANDRTLADPQVVRIEDGARVRLRIINAASSTNFTIDTGRVQASAIAVDGNPIVPVIGRQFPLAVAQRLDLLLSLPREIRVCPILARQEGTAAQTGIILAKRGGYVRRLGVANRTIAPAVNLAFEKRLAATESLPDRQVDRHETIDLTGSMAPYAWGFNGKRGTEIEPMRVKHGERVIWTLRNRTDMAHPIHLHGHHFQIVRIDDQRLRGAMRDTILVPVGGEVDIAFDADNPGRWAFHCHHLYHMVTGMMTTVEYEKYA